MKTYHLREWMVVVIGLAKRIMANLPERIMEATNKANEHGN